MFCFVIIIIIIIIILFFFIFIFIFTVVELLKLLNDSIMILDRENLSHSCTQCWSVN